MPAAWLTAGRSPKQFGECQDIEAAEPGFAAAIEHFDQQVGA